MDVLDVLNVKVNRHLFFKFSVHNAYNFNTSQDTIYFLDCLFAFAKRHILDNTLLNAVIIIRISCKLLYFYLCLIFFFQHVK
jgi:hypothetical protein